jgi:hypothetical protein
MKEQLAALWAKIVENKAVVIKTGGAVAGAVVGLVVAAMLSSDESTQLTDADILDFSDQSE